MLYEYKCPQCGKVLEIEHTIREFEEERPCPDCGAVLEHQVSATEFVLVGSGWARDGYGRKV